MKNINTTKHSVKYFLVLGLIALLSFPADLFAQGKIELSPLVGYQFGGRARFYEGEIRIKDNMNYGLAMDVALAHGTKLELSWTYMDSEATFKPYYGFDLKQGKFGIASHYFQVGGLREVDLDNEKLKPYGLFSLGAAYFDTRDGVEDVWRFAVALGGGLKVWITDRVGLRFQGRFLMPLYFAGGGLFCGIGTGGSGCGVSVGSTATILQGDFSGGLIFSLGD